MSKVVDANILAALVLPLPYSRQAEARFTSWKQAGTRLLAPVLMEYELGAVLRKAVVAGWIARGEQILFVDSANKLAIRRL